MSCDNDDLDSKLDFDDREDRKELARELAEEDREDLIYILTGYRPKHAFHYRNQGGVRDLA